MATKRVYGVLNFDRHTLKSVTIGHVSDLNKVSLGAVLVRIGFFAVTKS